MKDIPKKITKRMLKPLDDEDWVVPPIREGKPLDGLPELPVVHAGDGGIWVPVYIYLKGRKKKPRG